MEGRTPNEKASETLRSRGLRTSPLGLEQVSKTSGSTQFSCMAVPLVLERVEMNELLRLFETMDAVQLKELVSIARDMVAASNR